MDTRPNSVPRRQFIAATSLAAVGALSPKISRAADNAVAPVRLGFIGVGSRGSTLLRLMAQQAGTRIVAVCENEPGKLDRAKKIVTDAGRPAPETFAEWKKLLEHREVDVVVSALPVDLHAPCYLDMLAGHAYTAFHVSTGLPLLWWVDGSTAIVGQRRGYKSCTTHANKG